MKVFPLPPLLLHSKQTLASLEYIQQCLKFDWDIHLKLSKRGSVCMELARTVSTLSWGDTPTSPADQPHMSTIRSS